MLLISVAACSAPVKQASGLVIDRIIFLNKSGSALHNIEVHASASKGLVNCGYIPVGRDCSVGFKARTVPAQAVTVEWEQGGQRWQAAPVIARQNASDIDSPNTHTVIISFDEQNRVKVEIRAN
ncbi:MAG: hypothetical protein AAF420_05330 [Pseudomonadota bacterium]